MVFIYHIIYTKKNIIFNRKCGVFVPHIFPQKIARYSLLIYTHPHDLGGGGFPRFTSSPLATHTQQHTKRHATQEARWKLKSETRNWEIPVLFVVKMKIRHVHNAKWRIVKVKTFYGLLFALHTHAMQGKSTIFRLVIISNLMIFCYIMDWLLNMDWLNNWLTSFIYCSSSSS